MTSLIMFDRLVPDPTPTALPPGVTEIEVTSIVELPVEVTREIEVPIEVTRPVEVTRIVKVEAKPAPETCSKAFLFVVHWKLRNVDDTGDKELINRTVSQVRDEIAHCTSDLTLDTFNVLLDSYEGVNNDGGY